MQLPHNRYSQFILLAGDVILLNLSFLLAGILRFAEIRLEDTVYFDYYLQLWAFVNLLWLVLSLALKTYNTGFKLEPRKSAGKTLQAFFWHLFFLLLLIVSLKKGEYSRLFLSYFYLFAVASILPWHFYYLRFIRAARKRGSYTKKAALVGDGQRLQAFINAVNKNPEYGVDILATFCDQPLEGAPFMQYPESELKAWLEEDKVHELYVAYPPGDIRYQKSFYLADQNLVRYRTLPDLGLRHSKNLQIHFYDDVPVLTLRSEPLQFWHNRTIKRAGDVIVSVFIILTVFPWLFPLLALGVRLSGAGPIFFQQERNGYLNEPFMILKFRSMVPNSEADTQQATVDDARITRFGRFMRKHHLDELPQFFNILKGEMSLVGPRPHMLEHTFKYHRIIESYMVRHLVLPGITGLSQVKGLSGEHDIASMEERVRTDVYYLENWSPLLDAGIILRTIWVMIFGKRD